MRNEFPPLLAEKLVGRVCPRETRSRRVLIATPRGLKSRLMELGSQVGGFGHEVDDPSRVECQTVYFRALKEAIAKATHMFFPLASSRLDCVSSTCECLFSSVQMCLLKSANRRARPSRSCYPPDFLFCSCSLRHQ